MYKKYDSFSSYLEDTLYNPIFSVEVVNQLVLKGMPFRDAYKKVGHDIMDGKFTPSTEIHHTHEGSIGNLCNNRIELMMQQIISEFDFEKVTASINALLNRK